MSQITLAEYCAIHHIDPGNARRRAASGKLGTAVKIGRDWLIDENESWVDGRKKKSSK